MLPIDLRESKAPTSQEQQASTGSTHSSYIQSSPEHAQTTDDKLEDAELVSDIDSGSDSIHEDPDICMRLSEKDLLEFERREASKKEGTESGAEAGELEKKLKITNILAQRSDSAACRPGNYSSSRTWMKKLCGGLGVACLGLGGAGAGVYTYGKFGKLHSHGAVKTKSNGPTGCVNAGESAARNLIKKELVSNYNDELKGVVFGEKENEEKVVQETLQGTTTGESELKPALSDCEESQSEEGVNLPVIMQEVSCKHAKVAQKSLEVTDIATDDQLFSEGELGESDSALVFKSEFKADSNSCESGNKTKVNKIGLLRKTLVAAGGAAGLAWLLSSGHGDVESLTNLMASESSGSTVTTAAKDMGSNVAGGSGTFLAEGVGAGAVVGVGAWLCCVMRQRWIHHQDDWHKKFPKAEPLIKSIKKNQDTVDQQILEGLAYSDLDLD